MKLKIEFINSDSFDSYILFTILDPNRLSYTTLENFIIALQL